MCSTSKENRRLSVVGKCWIERWMGAWERSESEQAFRFGFYFWVFFENLVKLGDRERLHT